MRVKSHYSVQFLQQSCVALELVVANRRYPTKKCLVHTLIYGHQNMWTKEIVVPGCRYPKKTHTIEKQSRTLRLKMVRYYTLLYYDNLWYMSTFAILGISIEPWPHQNPPNCTRWIHWIRHLTRRAKSRSMLTWPAKWMEIVLRKW